MLLLSVAFLVLAALFMAAEAIYEKDWPRDTYKYGVIALGLFLFWLAV